MVKKKVTRKVISKTPAKESETALQKGDSQVASKASESIEATRTKRACFFCQSKTKPSYVDSATLRRFITDRAKIIVHTRSGLCSMHQRVLTRHIKYARHLALLPFTPKV